MTADEAKYYMKGCLQGAAMALAKAVLPGKRKKGKTNNHDKHSRAFEREASPRSRRKDE